MIEENTAATNDRDIASNLFFLYQDNSLEPPKQDKGTSPTPSYVIRDETIQEDSTSEDDIQRCEPLEPVDALVQPQDNAELHQLLFVAGSAIATIDSDSIHTVVLPNFPKDATVQWESNRAHQSSTWLTKHLVSDVSWGYVYNNIMRHSQGRRTLGGLTAIDRWRDSWVIYPRSLSTVPLTANADLEHH